MKKYTYYKKCEIDSDSYVKKNELKKKVGLYQTTTIEVRKDKIELR